MKDIVCAELIENMMIGKGVADECKFERIHQQICGSYA